MKKIYVKPEILVRNIRIKSYMVTPTTGGGSDTPPVGTQNFEPASIWSRQLSKDRNDIWDSGDDEASAW